MAIRSAQCLSERSEYAKCVAENEARTSKGGFGGCAVGALAALLTGGAAAPLTLGGCAGGLVVGTASQTSCGESPVCTPDHAVLSQSVLASHNLTAWPQCP